MRQPLVSIIVPIYNAEKYLDRCMKSLLNQTYHNTEIVLVDDGSSDHSAEVCRKYTDQYEKVRFFQKSNGGAASARNFGIDHARGEYLAFVDADDYVQDIFIEKLLNLCLTYNSEIAMCDFVWVHTDECNFEQLVENKIQKVNTPMEMMYRCCNKNKIIETIIPNKLYKKSLFDDLRYPEGMTYEDLAMTHQILYKATSIAECNNKMYAYFMSDNSVTRKKYNIHNFRSENKAQDERIVFFRDIGEKQLFQKAVLSVQRNRVANFCKCYRELPEYKKERDQLRQKFNKDSKYLKDYKNINWQDRVLFFMFKISPVFCAKILWPVYVWKEEKSKQ